VLLPSVAFDCGPMYYLYASQIGPLLFESKIWAWLDLHILRLTRLDASATLYGWVNRFRKNPFQLTNKLK